MTITYAIELIHRHRDARVTELREAVATELLEIGLHRSVNVVVDESPPAPDVPSLAVYLGDEMAAVDPDILAEVRRAIVDGRVVMPVVDDLAYFQRDTPDVLRALNGFGWIGASSARTLARILLAELGIEDQKRRVFISHKREDGLGAAEQLHDALTHVRFTPFIDRFAIRAGQPVQASIADALEDHAFLLLLETPLAYSSDWVFDEVDYALTHTMGALIVRWPSASTAVPGSASLPRLKLEASDVVTDSHNYEILGAGALERVVEAVEAAHAHGLVRRRRMLVRSIEEAAAAAGASSCVPLPDWRLRVEHKGRSTLVGVTPRLPTATDLQDLDTARAGTDAAILVHSARTLRTQRKEHLKWVTRDRDLELVPENAIGGRWR